MRKGTKKIAVGGVVIAAGIIALPVAGALGATGLVSAGVAAITALCGSMLLSDGIEDNKARVTSISEPLEPVKEKPFGAEYGTGSTLPPVGDGRSRDDDFSK